MQKEQKQTESVSFHSENFRRRSRYTVVFLGLLAAFFVIIPGTFFAGAVFCMSCDLIARMALAPVELNISTVTSIVGAPIVIYMMVKREKGR